MSGSVKVSKVVRQVPARGDLQTEITIAHVQAERQAKAQGEVLPGFRVYVVVEQDFIERD